jgi:hypothetical protein
VDDQTETDLKGKEPWNSDLLNFLIVNNGLMILVCGSLFLYDRFILELLFLFIFFLALLAFGFFYLYLHNKYHSMLTKSDRRGFIIFGLIVILASIIGIFFSISHALNLLSNPPSVYLTNVNEIFAMVYSVFGSLIAGLIFIVVGLLLLRKNYQSKITRKFFLSFASISATWFIYFLFLGIRANLENYIYLIKISYLVFNACFFSGLVLLAQACRLLTPTKHPYISRNGYLLLLIPFIVSVILIITRDDLPFMTNTLDPEFSLLPGKISPTSLVFLSTFLISLLIPVGYSIYRLSIYPEWLTPERRKWIRKIRIGLLLMIPSPIGETVTNLWMIGFLQEPISATNPLSRFLFLNTISSLFLLYTATIFLFSLPDVNKWFFDEVKIRSTPDIIKINPDVNLSEIWEKIDEWQKTKPLTPREMTEKKLDEYVVAAKKLLLEEGHELPTI